MEPSTYTRDTSSTWLTGTPGIFWTLGYLAYQRYPEHLDTPGMTGRPGALGYLVYQGYLKRLHVNYSKDTQSTWDTWNKQERNWIPGNPGIPGAGALGVALVDAGDEDVLEPTLVVSCVVQH